MLPSGTGNVNENAEKTLAWWLTISFVGPRQTEYASTHGMTNATSTTQESSSKNQRNPQARNVIVPSFPKFASTWRPERPQSSANTRKPAVTSPRRETDRSESGSTISLQRRRPPG